MYYVSLGIVFIIILWLMGNLSDRLESRIEDLEEFAAKDEKRIKKNTKTIKKLSKNK